MNSLMIKHITAFRTTLDAIRCIVPPNYFIKIRYIKICDYFNKLDCDNDKYPDHSDYYYYDSEDDKEEQDENDYIEYIMNH